MVSGSRRQRNRRLPVVVAAVGFGLASAFVATLPDSSNPPPALDGATVVVGHPEPACKPQRPTCRAERARRQASAVEVAGP
jgi:hypothetical protein